MSFFSLLSDDCHACLLGHLSGREGAHAQVAVPSWHKLLADQSRWREFSEKEFGKTAAHAASLRAKDWFSTYQRLSAASRLTSLSWSCEGREHGLGDRVAQPQMFVGSGGRRIFNYGGWTNRGPQVDLLWAEMPTWPRGEGCKLLTFQPSRSQGRPAFPGGVQTLTPLWIPGGVIGDKPGMASIAKLQGPAADAALAGTSDLVLAVGGAQGGYGNEHGDWSVGALEEGEGSIPSQISWSWRAGQEPGRLQPMSRGAHTATFVPGRLGGDQFPEGCVIVFGGHTNHCSQSLSVVEVLSLHDWRWQLCAPTTGPLPRPRHGHSATLVEVDGRGFLVIVGGGTGNILSFAGISEYSTVDILDVSDWRWQGSLDLTYGVDWARIMPPIPGRHHSASRGLGQQVLIFGGGRSPPGALCVLDGKQAVLAARQGASSVQLREINVRRDSPPSVYDRLVSEHGSCPVGRKMHGAVSLLPWLPAYVLFGGWQTGQHFDDLWLCALDDSLASLEKTGHPVRPMPAASRILFNALKSIGPHALTLAILLSAMLCSRLIWGPSTK